MAKLDEMANSVNVARGVAAVILENFQKIALARKRMWTWAQITAAIVNDYPNINFTESAVQSAFKRIERGVRNKKIKPLKAMTEVAQRKVTAVSSISGAESSDYGGFDKPKPKRVFDDD